MRRPADTAWTEFVADLLPRRENDVWRNGVIGEIPDDAVGRWLKLHEGLAKVPDQVALGDLSAVQTWVPRIRRFSYVLPEVVGRDKGNRPTTATASGDGDGAGQRQ